MKKKQSRRGYKSKFKERKSLNSVVYNGQRRRVETGRKIDSELKYGIK